MRLEEFILNSALRNHHVTWENFSLYVRRATRLINGEKKQCLDIGVIENTDAKSKGKGQFWQFIFRLRAALPASFDGIYIESVLNPRLVKSLRQDRRFTEITNSIPPSFYIAVI